MSRCKICSANDHDALVDEVAEEMWNTQRSSDPASEWTPWDDAGSYWQTIMRQFASATINALSRQ